MILTPGIERHLKVIRITIKRKLCGCQFADGYGSCCFKFLDYRSVRRRHVLPEQTRTVGGAYPSGINDVLDRDRKAVQRASVFSTLDLRISRPRLFHGKIARYRVEDFVFGIEPLNPLKNSAGHFGRRYFPVLNQLGNFQEPPHCDALVIHRLPPALLSASQANFHRLHSLHSGTAAKVVSRSTLQIKLHL